MPARPSRLSGDDGSSIAEFAMISILLVFLLFAVLQVAALFYVRSVAAAAASDGARYAANADIDPSAGGSRASAAIGQGLGVGMARSLPCTSAVLDAGNGLQATQVRCSGRIRSVFLPIGAFVTVDVTGQSLREVP
jgi:hypothetical protein